MSFVIANPALVSNAASQLADIWAAVGAVNAAAMPPTVQVLAAAGDEVSAAIAALFATHGQQYHAASAQATSFGEHFPGRSLRRARRMPVPSWSIRSRCSGSGARWSATGPMASRDRANPVRRAGSCSATVAQAVPARQARPEVRAGLQDCSDVVAPAAPAAQPPRPEASAAGVATAAPAGGCTAAAERAANPVSPRAGSAVPPVTAAMPA